jgi:hypothetical protein
MTSNQHFTNTTGYVLGFFLHQRASAQSVDLPAAIMQIILISKGETCAYEHRTSKRSSIVHAASFSNARVLPISGNRDRFSQIRCWPWPSTSPLKLIQQSFRTKQKSNLYFYLDQQLYLSKVVSSFFLYVASFVPSLQL